MYEMILFTMYIPPAPPLPAPPSASPASSCDGRALGLQNQQLDLQSQPKKSMKNTESGYIESKLFFVTPKV
jgi:hypothetical protein